METITNPITELNLYCQKVYRKSITTKVVKIEGEPHIPTITVEIRLPNGEVYKETASNQKIAKQLAAEKALQKILK